MKIATIGLGYVGLPLGVALARHFSLIGFDISAPRIKELESGHDRTGEVAPEVLAAALASGRLDLTALAEDMAGADIYIVTVPTPVTKDNKPDLSALLSACESVGHALRETKEQTSEKPIVVFESTVYPGVTEDICGPALEKASGKKCGKDFFLGYSPERINPGDKEHTVERITKVVAGQNDEVARRLEKIYGTVTSGGVFIARDIKTAEAAKVIENAQRDVNIAFINEVAQIFQKLGLSVHDVLAASRTKWNFLPFSPGLVGGHCIGIDPYYLAHCAQGLNHHPEVILAGRKINDGMGAFIGDSIHGMLKDDSPADILVLGLTFKEDVPDLRNSKVIDVIRSLTAHGHKVAVHDPHADLVEAKEFYGIDLLDELSGSYDCLVGAVAHEAYCRFDTALFDRLLKSGGLVADIKGMWRDSNLPEGARHWSL